MTKDRNTVMAIAAHPDDIEFMMAGTLILLKQRGWDVHYMNIANGCCGTDKEAPEVIAATRRTEAMNACARLGATFHESLVDDLAIYHTPKLVARLTAIIREVKPRVLLVQSPSDYMEDHMNACRVAVTAAFSRGIRNALCEPPRPPVMHDMTVYHAQPHGLRDPLRRLIRAGQYVDITAVIDKKRALLAEHRSQKEWLDVSQGLDAYLDAMTEMSAQMGRMSATFEYAEGWRRHHHPGFCGENDDPLTDALGGLCRINTEYERMLDA